MIVLALGVDQLPERARLVEHAHRVAIFVEVRSFEHHVLAAARFNGFEQCGRVLERTKRSGYCAGHMLAVFEDVGAMPRMARRVRGHEHRLERVVLHQFFE